MDDVSKPLPSTLPPDDEAELAQRAAKGEQAAFNVLYDRYFARMSCEFRDLPELERQAAIWEALEQLFANLDAGDDRLSERAFKIARHTGRGWREIAS